MDAAPAEFAGIVGGPLSDWDYHDRAGMKVVALPARGGPPPPTIEMVVPFPTAEQVTKVAQPSVRHRGPRRGHVGARRRPAARRTTTSARAGPKSDDPHQGDDDDEHRRLAGPFPRLVERGWR